MRRSARNLQFAGAPYIHAAATPSLLRALDEPAFRANLSALLGPAAGGAAVAALPAAALLARAEAEWAVAETVHNFDPRPETTSMSCLNCVDPDLAIASNTSWFVNDWEMLLLANTPDPPAPAAFLPGNGGKRGRARKSALSISPSVPWERRKKKN